MLLATRLGPGPGAASSRAGLVAPHPAPVTAATTAARPALRRTAARTRDKRLPSLRLARAERVVARLRRGAQAGPRRDDVLAVFLHLHLDHDRAHVGREGRADEPRRVGARDLDERAVVEVTRLDGHLRRRRHDAR